MSGQSMLRINTSGVFHLSRGIPVDAVKKNVAPPVEQPAEVGAGLLLGDFDDAKNLPHLRSRGVGAVLDLSGRLRNN